MNTTLIILGIAVGVGLIIMFAVRSERKRVAALQNAATLLGFSFENKGSRFRAELGNQLHLLKRGHGGSLSNVMRGNSSAGEITLFEYRFSEGGGENKATYLQTVAAFRVPGSALPEFHLGAEHWWHKVGKALGYKIIQFESHPQFNERFLLRGPDEEAVRRFFVPPVLNYLQSQPEKPIWNIEAGGSWLIVYVLKKLYKPDQLQLFRDHTAEIAGNVMSGAEIARARSEFARST